MSNKYQVIAYIGAFIPTEKVLFKSRFEWLARKVAAYHIKRKYSTVPVKFVKPDGSQEWLNDWAKQSLDEQKAELDLVGNTEERCDVLAIKENVIRGSQTVDLTEVTEEQVLREITQKMSPQKTESLDEATSRLESIRKEMEITKQKARGKITIIKG